MHRFHCYHLRFLGKSSHRPLSLLLFSTCSLTGLAKTQSFCSKHLLGTYVYPSKKKKFLDSVESYLFPLALIAIVKGGGFLSIGFYNFPFFQDYVVDFWGSGSAISIFSGKFCHAINGYAEPAKFFCHLPCASFLRVTGQGRQITS